MKVVEAISDSGIGGAGVLLLTRLAQSDRTRFSYHVLVPRGSALAERLRKIEGVTVWELNCRGERSFSWGALVRSIRILRYLSPDLVNCHGSLACRVAAWLCRVSCRIYTRHCAYEPKAWQTVFPWKWLIGKVQTVLSHKVIAVAEAAKQNLCDVGVPPDRIEVIVNGVEGLRAVDEEDRKKVRQIYGIPDKAPVVSICARLEWCKDHQTFLRTAERLLARSERYHFLVIGTGSLDKSLRDECVRRGIASHVHFTGFVRDVAPLFSITKVNVNCSVGTETSSLALSEGMSLGIPALVSDYGGNPYMVRDGENGFVFAQRDDKRLTELIEQVISDENLYARLSVGAYRRFRDELNAKKMTKETEELYEKLLCFFCEVTKCRAGRWQC